MSDRGKIYILQTTEASTMSLEAHRKGALLKRISRP